MPERNPQYDGVYVYTVDVGKLLPGDILLTRNAETNSSTKKIQASVIAATTGGSFSHALLCTVSPTFIEAIGQGVSNITAQSCFAHDLKNVRLLRYRDETIAAEAGRKSMHFLGRKYSLLKAIRAISPQERVSDNVSAELFCSALVAIAYQQAGAKEFATLNPMKVTPATLEHAGYLVDVTDDVFVKCLSPSNIELMSALDGDRILSPLNGQAQLFQEYCKILIPKIEAFIDKTPELTFERRPISFFECISFIVAARRACGNLSEVAAEIPLKKIMAIDDAAYDLLTDGRYDQMRLATETNDEESLRYTLEQSFLPHPDIDENQTRSLIAATRSQITSRSRANESSEVVSTRVQKRWLEMADEVIQTQKRRLQVLEEAFRRAFPGKSY